MKLHSQAIDKFLSSINTEYMDNLIYQDNDSVYTLFNKYFIKKINTSSVVYRKTDGGYFEFSSSKIATAWCILDRYNKIFESRRIIELNNKIISLTAEKLNLIKLRNRAKAEQSEIYRDKLSEIITRQNQFQWELDKYIILAKQCQQRGFENELTRTSSK